MSLLPVKYSGQKNAWMTSAVFHDWFHNTFVPYVCTKLAALGQDCKAVLLLDNCSAHPDASELVNDDGAIVAKFLPPNVTSLIQPMDQGVLQALKRRYKKKLLRRLIIEDDRGVSVIDFLKTINMKTVADFIAEAWDEIQPSTLRKSWQKILPLPLKTSTNTRSLSDSAASGSKSPPPSMEDLDHSTDPLAELFELACDLGEDTEDLLPLQSPSKSTGGFAYWRGIRIRLSHNDEITSATQPLDLSEPENLDEFQSMFEELGFEMDKGVISEWLESESSISGVQIYTDEDLCDMVTMEATAEGEEADSEEEEEEESTKCPVSNSNAAHYFEQCLIWLEHQPEASVYNTSVLRELRSLAANKRIDSLEQSKISKYFRQFTENN